MTPKELIERFQVLSRVGKPTDTVLMAPGNPAYASRWVTWLNTDSEMSARGLEGQDTDSEMSARGLEGQVTGQDLRDLLEHIETLEYIETTHERIHPKL
jgi:hypothetical protein